MEQIGDKRHKRLNKETKDSTNGLKTQQMDTKDSTNGHKRLNKQTQKTQQRDKRLNEGQMTQQIA